MSKANHPAGISEIHAVTVSTGDLQAARHLFEQTLGMQPRAQWQFQADDSAASRLRQLWNLPEATAAQCLWLEQSGARHGHIRLVQFQQAAMVGRCANENARPYDYGLIKNLDFFTDEIEAQYRRLTDAGFSFLSAPVTYPLPWGAGRFAAEAHLPVADGFKISLAQMTGTPRRAFGESDREALFTEVAAATQIVRDFDKSLFFYKTVFDCVPAAETIIDDRALVAALKLPDATRLRMCFIGHPGAVGGKIGLVAYEGPGVADARSLAAQSCPPHRGAVMLTFLTDDVDMRFALALVNGAKKICTPIETTLPPFGNVRAASITSPDGILIELIEKMERRAFERVRLFAVQELASGQMRQMTLPKLGRIVIARTGDQYFALEDRCPHLSAPLSQGALNGDTITCPWHGWEINVMTGSVCGREACAQTRARCFRLRIDDQQVWLEMNGF